MGKEGVVIVSLMKLQQNLNSSKHGNMINTMLMENLLIFHQILFTINKNLKLLVEVVQDALDVLIIKEEIQREYVYNSNVKVLNIL